MIWSTWYNYKCCRIIKGETDLLQKVFSRNCFLQEWENVRDVILGYFRVKTVEFRWQRLASPSMSHS